MPFTLFWTKTTGRGTLMNIRRVRQENQLLINLVFRLLPVQALIVAMGSINSLVDGVAAARSISPAMIGVIGLYYSLLRILEAVSAVLLGGSAVLCGRYMGRGKIDKTTGIFSLNLSMAFICGAVVTILSLAVPSHMADWLGADQTLKNGLIPYIQWYAIGILPMLLGQQLASFLQLEHQGKRCYIGITAMILTNIGLDILLVVFLKMDFMGLALATSISNWVYFLILVTYYFSREAQLSFHFSSILWSDFPTLVMIGFPGALLVFCLAARSLVINRVLLIYSGNEGLAAMTVFNMISGLLLALPLGAGAVVRMLTSVNVGEEDKESVILLIRIMYTYVLAATVAVGLAVFLFSRQLAGLFFADPASEVFSITKQFFSIYSVCIPLVLACAVSSNYFQAIGHIWFVNVLSVFDGFLAMVIPALLLAPVLGATGVWLSILIGIIITALLSPIYSILRCKSVPASLSEWLLIPQVFPENGKRFAVTLNHAREISSVAERVQAFCELSHIGHVIASNAALCMEEMALNIFQHGFRGNRRNHSVDLRVIIRDKRVILRIKDNGIPFNPKEFVEMLRENSPYKNIGTRIVHGLASDITYQNLIGLNVLTLVIENY